MLQVTVVLLITCLLVNFTTSNHKNLYSNTWAIEVEGGEEEANRIAEKYGYMNLGKVRESFHGIYHKA